MALEKISIRTLRQEVYDQLWEKIISAEILPGESITLRKLASKFGVSLMPVREALWQLESEKIIVTESNRRIRVNIMTAKEMEDALRLRLVLEPMAAEMACDWRQENDIRRLKHFLEGMEASIERPRIFMRKNTQFHSSIYFLSGSPLLLQAIRRLWARVVPYVYNYVINNPNDLPLGMEIHWEIFEALKDRDKERIKRTLAQDLESTARLIIPTLDKWISPTKERKSR